MTECTVFAGPSTCGLGARWHGEPALEWLPPARRGDVDALVRSAPAHRVMVVCDGVFKSAAAVGHAEICRALDAGWQVWGVSSLGAIRAFELRGEGMRGFGEVYAMFDRFDDFTDDEMCLVHFPQAPWFALSEPLVNLRHGLERRGPALGIGADQAETALERLSRLWFGDRTLARMHATLAGAAGVAPDRAQALLDWVTRNRVKTTDLEELLRRAPWRRPAPTARTP